MSPIAPAAAVRRVAENGSAEPTPTASLFFDRVLPPEEIKSLTAKVEPSKPVE